MSYRGDYNSTPPETRNGAIDLLFIKESEPKWAAEKDIIDLLGIVAFREFKKWRQGAVSALNTQCQKNRNKYQGRDMHNRGREKGIKEKENITGK